VRLGSCWSMDVSWSRLFIGTNKSEWQTCNVISMCMRDENLFGMVVALWTCTKGVEWNQQQNTNKSTWVVTQTHLHPTWYQGLECKIQCDLLLDWIQIFCDKTSNKVMYMYIQMTIWQRDVRRGYLLFWRVLEWVSELSILLTVSLPPSGVWDDPLLTPVCIPVSNNDSVTIQNNISVK
jgi:hypothetical protein